MAKRFVRVKEACRRAGGVTNMTLWRWEQQGRWPKRKKLGRNMSGYLEEEIDAALVKMLQEGDES